VAAVYLGILALFGLLMISRRLTATLALPLTAFCLASAAGIQLLAAGHPVADTLRLLLTDVLDAGVVRLSSAVFAVILGAVLAAQLRLSGAAERIVRYAAEYAGEDRFRLALLLLLTIATLFTVLGGLGSVILVASITLPLLFTLGFEPRVAAAIFLFGLSLGGALNPVNWALYITVLKLSQAEIVPFALMLFALFLLVVVAYLIVQTRGQTGSRRILQLGVIVIMLSAIGYVALRMPGLWVLFKRGFAISLAVVLLVLALLLLLRVVLVYFGRPGQPASPLLARDNWLAGCSVLVPLALLLWSNLQVNLLGPELAVQVPILAALLAGVVFAAAATITRESGSVNLTMRALHEGITGSAPALVLLIGVGLLLQATALPPVRESLAPLVAHLPVGSPMSFVATFFVLSPLSLYRGPLNLFGMGSGIVDIISGSGILTAGLTMVAFFSVGMLQGVCDPTNTHNVWIANFCKVPVAELTRHTVPWVLIVVALGLVAGAASYLGAF
jgi:hypothetical protein